MNFKYENEEVFKRRKALIAATDKFINYSIELLSSGKCREDIQKDKELYDLNLKAVEGRHIDDELCLISDAINVFVSRNKEDITVPFMEARLNIGNKRTEKVMLKLEEYGVLAPFDGTSRKVIATDEVYEQMCRKICEQLDKYLAGELSAPDVFDMERQMYKS